MRAGRFAADRVAEGDIRNAIDFQVLPQPDALRLVRIGAAGLLLLVTLVAPPILARRESGRVFFAAAMGREVLAWGAWRTAWMSGYFYNDGRVREVASPAEITAAVDRGPTLVLAGPSERRRLEAMAALEVHVLVRGVRDNTLLRIEKRLYGRPSNRTEKTTGTETTAP